MSADLTILAGLNVIACGTMAGLMASDGSEGWTRFFALLFVLNTVSFVYGLTHG